MEAITVKEKKDAPKPFSKMKDFIRRAGERIGERWKRMLTYALIGATLGLGASHALKKEDGVAQYLAQEKKIEVKVDRLPTDAVYEEEVTRWIKKGVIDNSTLSGIAAQLIAKELGKEPSVEIFKTNLDAVMHLVKAIAKDNGILNPNLIYPGSMLKVQHKDILAAAEMVNGGPIKDVKTEAVTEKNQAPPQEKPDYIWVAFGAALGAAAGMLGKNERKDGLEGEGIGSAPPKYEPPKPKYNHKKIKSFSQIKGLDEKDVKELQKSAKEEYKKDPELKKKYKTYEKYESKLAKTVALSANIHEYVKDMEKKKKESAEASKLPSKIQKLKEESAHLRKQAESIKKEIEEEAKKKPPVPQDGLYPDQEQVAIDAKLKQRAVQEKEEKARALEKQAESLDKKAQKLQAEMEGLLEKFQSAQEFSHIESALRELANRLRGRKITNSMLMAIEKVTGEKIDLNAYANAISDIKNVAEDCIKSSAADGSNRIYLWRDGAFFWFADLLLSSKRESAKAKSLLMPRALLTGPSFGFNYDKTIKDELGYRTANIVNKEYCGLSNEEKQAKFFEVYDGLFRDKFKNDQQFRERVIKLYQYIKANGSVDVESDGRIAPQTFIAADSGFLSFPPFVKSVVEVCAEEIDKRKPGEVKGMVYYHTVSSSAQYLPNLKTKKFNIGTMEEYGSTKAFLNPTSELKDSLLPKINKGNAKHSLAFFMAIAAKINENEPEEA